MQIMNYISKKKAQFKEKIKDNQRAMTMKKEEKLKKLKVENKELEKRKKLDDSLEKEKQKNKEMKYAKIKKFFPKSGKSENPFGLGEQNNKKDLATLGNPLGSTNFSKTPFPSKDMKAKNVKKMIDKTDFGL